jgi:transglutaminase-like putative cysteine protease
MYQLRHTRSRAVLAGVLFTISSTCLSQSTYLGLYMQGNKLGYASYTSTPDTLNGQKVTRSDSKTMMATGLLGTAMVIEINSRTWTMSTGAPLRMDYSMSSGGRTQTVLATFSASKISCAIDNAGTKTTKVINLNKDTGKIVDDPLSELLTSGLKVGSKRKVMVLDPTTVSLVPNDLLVKGETDVALKDGKTARATLIEIVDPRATTRVYLLPSGDLVKVEGPMGIEMYPESREIALAKPESYRPSADLAFATSIKTDVPIKNPATVKRLKLRITGRDLSRVPSDDHQTVSKDGDAWLVDIHPPIIGGSRGAPITDAARQQAQWTRPSLNIPSDSPRFKQLAAKIVGNRKATNDAAIAIKDYVYGIMSPNAGIGVLRNANDVLTTKEGVCRDYAILTATLMRAANIPARLASGLVNWDGEFYYHAWVEIWNGKRWLGVDSTTPAVQISASHVKLASGNVEEAFTFTFLEKAKIEVLNAEN